MIRRLLIANRGEIALRIMRTCRTQGVESVAVYSAADTLAPHVLAAEHAEPIGPAAPAESYLSSARLIDAARRAGADAVHPGYGFLAENAAFAADCRQAGLTFVGPSADVIARVGPKIEARRLAERAGVPVVPGRAPAVQSVEGIRDAVRDVGYPVLLKPSAGGGKGMRVVRNEAETDSSIRTTQREAMAAFADATIYVERHLERPRHVEVQVMGDRHGQVVHLFERECSIQRRYQKVIEESPSPAISDAIREQITAAAVAAAQAARYDNVGTVEFLVEGTGDDARSYFLEMNTRLQVEHPVTEMCTGVDLVAAQMEIAGGGHVPWRQDALRTRGHAIECRVYAEDAANDFLPQAGRLALYREPTGPGLRVDAGVHEGSEVPVQYDPLLAKVIAHGEARETARRRVCEALRRYAILGVTTNVAFLRRALDHPDFRKGRIDTSFIGTARVDLAAPDPGDALYAAMAAAAFERVHPPPADGRPGGGEHFDPWTTLTAWR